VATPFTMLDTITREEINPMVIDTYFNSHPVFRRITKRPKFINGGDVIEHPVQYAPNPDAGAWGGGYNTLPLNQHDFITKARFNWAHYVVPQVYAETDKLKNMGPAEIVDLAESIAENSMDTLRDTLGKDLYKDGANNAAGHKTIDGLSGALTYNANPSVGNYGGIDRSSSSGTQASYTGNAWWNGCVVASNTGSRDFWVGNFNFSNASTTLSLEKMNQMFTALMVADDAPDLIVMSPSLFAKLWTLVQVNERIPGGKETGEAGMRYIMFNGTPVVPDPNIDNSGKVYFLNTKYIHWRPSKSSNFISSGVRKPSRMRVVASYIFWDGNMVVSNPRMLGLVTGFTT
jgi:hypothetical protein